MWERNVFLARRQSIRFTGRRHGNKEQLPHRKISEKKPLLTILLSGEAFGAD